MDDENVGVVDEPRFMEIPPESSFGPTHGIGTFMRSDVDLKSNTIKVEEFSNYTENNLERITAEFKSVPVCKYYKCSVARRPQNVLNRNRYYFSEAYDHSRVVLKVVSDENEDSEQCNDYIAANHVDSFNERNQFIATQAPLPQTITDYWRMIWDYHCSQIVNLSNITENSFHREDKYWPDEYFVKYGDIAVVYKNKKYHKDFEVLTYELENNSVKREIEHYNFLSWPDRKVPVDFNSILDLIKTIKQSKFHTPNNPIVVHCLAGVGCTGTFILIYNMIEMGEQCGYVDLYKYFIKLRCQRAYSVLAFEQYLYAHKFIANYFSKK